MREGGRKRTEKREGRNRVGEKRRVREWCVCVRVCVCEQMKNWLE